jgi:hypothetical protein
MRNKLLAVLALTAACTPKIRAGLLSVAGAVLLTCLAAQQVSADGLVFRPIAYEGSLNERSQEAIIIFHNGDKPGEATQDLILKISVQGDVDQFAWVVPLPSAPQTGEEDAKLFEELHKYVQARLVAGGGRPKKEDGLNSAGEAAPATARDVEVISRETVGSFDVSIVKENRAGSLNQWLTNNKYQPVPGGDVVIEWYRKKGYVFACMRVSDAALFKDRAVDLHPLRFSFKTGGRDGIFFPMRLTGLQEERFDINLYVFYDKWVNDRLSPYGYVHRDFYLRWRDYDSDECIANAGKLWSTPKEDPYLRGYAHLMPAVTKMFQRLHRGKRYYLTNVYARGVKPSEVLAWKDDLWMFPYYTNRNFVPYDAREGGVAALGYQ